MGKRGPAPKPTALRVLSGNASHRPLPAAEPKPQPVAPKCPSWLLPEAKKLYKRLAAQLEPLGLLTEVDGPALAGYCQAYARWREAEEFLSKAQTTVIKTESGYLMQLPQVSIAQKNLELMAKLGAKFGLSPADRVGLGVKRPGQKSKFQAYLEKGKGKKQA